MTLRLKEIAIKVHKKKKSSNIEFDPSGIRAEVDLVTVYKVSKLSEKCTSQFPTDRGDNFRCLVLSKLQSYSKNCHV